MIAQDIIRPLCQTAQLAAAVAPVPWLSPIIGAVSAIAQLCQNVTTNKNAIFQLRNRCESLLQALLKLSGGEDAPPRGLQEAVIVAGNSLEIIRNKLDNWSKLSRIRAFAMQQEIADEVQRYHTDISDCLAKFQLASDNEIHHWQEQFEACRSRDHDEIMQSLAEIHTRESDIFEKVNQQSDDMRELMRMMQNSLSMNSSSDQTRKLQKGLHHVSQRSGELLPDFNLKRGEVVRLGRDPVGGTSTMDIWEGLYLQTEKVAIKVIRAAQVRSDPKSLRRFMREVKVWGEIWKIDRGEHVLPFLGFCQDDGPYPYMVSPWQENGNAIDYVKKHFDVDYKALIRGIAQGLRVLHTMHPPMIHGDLKGVNIVINNWGSPLLADFGLAQIVEDISGVPLTQSRGVSDSYRWFAPEVCIGQGVLSTHSDIYAFAMTALELITHRQPYFYIKHTTEVVIQSSRGEHPRRPTDPAALDRGFNNELWTLLKKCWALEPTKRPCINEVLSMY